MALPHLQTEHHQDRLSQILGLGGAEFTAPTRLMGRFFQSGPRRVPAAALQWLPRDRGAEDE